MERSDLLKEILDDNQNDWEKIWKFKIDKLDIKEDIIKKIGEFADKCNYKVFAVGGFVRDYYLDRPRTDIDCTVIGDSIDFAKRLAKAFNTKAVIYERFRTALVPIGEYHCEFVGTRKEEYSKNSRKPITSEGTFADDIKRRDFTLNSMVASINEYTFGDVIDLFDGKTDLDNGNLRTPLDPHTTYSDDPLRMMRAARFASQLRFRVDVDSFNAISDMAKRIKIISQERITDEFLKIMKSPKPSIGLHILHKTGLMEFIFPDLHRLSGIDLVEEGEKKFAHKDVFKHTLRVLDRTAEMSDNVWLRFAALLHDIAKPKCKRFIKGHGWSFHGHEEIGARWVKGIFKRMKLPLEHIDYVERLVRLHQRPMVLVDQEVTDSAVRRLAVKAGAALEDLFLLCKADITTNNPNLSEKYLNNYQIVANKVLEVQEKDKLREFQSPVRGEEIMELCNLDPSRAVGYIKTQIEEAILDGIIPNEYEPAKEYFLENKESWLKDIEEEKHLKKRED